MISIALNRSSETALYVQIRDAIREAVDSGDLRPGNRLPTVNALAKEVGVTQCTVRRALEDLTKEGLVASHVGRGTFIAEPGPEKEKQSEPEQSSAGGRRRRAGDGDPALSTAARRLRMGISKSLESLLPLVNRPGLIRFTQGFPDPDLLAEGVLDKLVARAMKRGQRTYQEYGDPFGLPELRHALAERFSAEGYPVTPEMILVTSGSQQAVSLMAQYALEQEMRVVCETPCYMGIPSAFNAVGHWVETIERDTDGPRPERLARFDDRQPTLLYNCPELHNPMGTDTSPVRRKALVSWAERNDSLLLDDEIFHDLHFRKVKRSGGLAGGDARHTVMVGSLSKSFMTGLRIGWMVSDADRIRYILTLKRSMDLGCPSLMQGVALAALESGVYDEHLPVVVAAYRQRCEALLAALKRHMPSGVSWTRPLGGYHMWIQLPGGYSGIALMLRAVERGVAIIPGPYSDPDHRFVNAFRLCFAPLAPEQIEEGVELLADAVRELLNESPGDTGLGGIGDLF